MIKDSLQIDKIKNFTTYYTNNNFDTIIDKLDKKYPLN